MRRIFSFIFVCCFASCALAQTRSQFSEASLLDILVAKNAITADEAAEIKKASAEVPVCEPVSVQSFRTLFISQMRYTYVYHDYSNTPFDVNDESRFNIRRLLPVFIADLTPDSMLMLSLYMPSSTLINTLHYEINLDGDVLAGKLKLGHWCVNFSMEENDSCSIIKAPDRSILCIYFGGGDSGYDGYMKTSYGTALGFSGYHTGVYWDGHIPAHKEFVYSLDVVNSKPNDIFVRNDNGISCFLTTAYDGKFDGWSLKAGATFGYSNKIVSAIEGTSILPSEVEDFGDALGVNPFVRFTYGDLSLDGEFFLTSLRYGRTCSDAVPLYTTHSGQAVPWGFYVLGAYKVYKSERWGEFEPVFRFTYLDTDGRGVRGCDVVYNMRSENGLYNNATAYYGGVNWYLDGRNFKVAAGIEHFDFCDSPLGGTKASVSSDVAILQFQMVF